ncbi:MAG TPA: hypothetical protein VHK88_00845, partial [Aquihabitans sp.]|nr:hypothetical protein [Aquihabitans sp.]
MNTRKRILATLVAATAVLTVPACGLGSNPSSDATSTTTERGRAAEPAAAIDIDAAIEASKDEGKLIVYGNPNADQWEPVLAAFNEA